MSAYYPLVEWHGQHYTAYVVDAKGKPLNDWGCFHAHRKQAAAEKCAAKMVRLFESVHQRGTEREGS